MPEDSLSQDPKNTNLPDTVPLKEPSLTRTWRGTVFRRHEVEELPVASEDLFWIWVFIIWFCTNVLFILTHWPFRDWTDFL
ncbi:hypothetical protein ACHAPX_010472 [Trichoderma viride]